MGKRPSILLAYPSCFFYPVWMERLQVKVPQLLLASYLARTYDVVYADFELTIGRPNSEIQIKRFKRRVREYFQSQDFDILALSCWTSLSYQATVACASICRELFPEKLIVVGGYHPSARPQEFILENQLFDYVVCGEGELAMTSIAEHFAVSGRPGATQIINGKTIPAEDFVPYNWDLIEPLLREHFPDGVSNVNLFLSRGCPFNCSFCMESLKEKRWTPYSPEVAVEEILRAVERFGAYAVPICDACFGLRRSWRREFLKLLLKHDPKFWIIFETRSEFLDPEDIEMMSQLKLEIQFGLESASPEMLSLMKKTKRPEVYLQRFREISHLCSEHKILHRANMIFNHPGETKKSLQETFTFVDEMLERDESYLMWACHGYMHFPGCDLDREREFYEREYGSKFLSTNWWRENADQYESSMQFVPSRDLDGEDVNLWRKMLDARQERMKATLAPQAFQFAARKYFLDWQNDFRYEQNKKTLGIH
ncbi:MAG: radical SAM protein [Candidatus Zixiibacteriota bacterium]